MSAPEPQLVHESETQRQYVRLKLPSRVEIDGHLFPVRDLSPGGLAAEGVPTATEGGTLPIKLYLPFEGFTLDIELTAQVRHYQNSTKILGLQFVDLSPDRVAALTYVVKAYIAGDVVNTGDILAVVSRDNFVKIRKKKTDGAADMSRAFRIRQFFGTFAIALAGLLVAGFILNNIYATLFRVQSSEAVIQGTIVNLSAPQSGIVQSLVAANTMRVKAGEPLAAIKVSVPPPPEGKFDPTQAPTLTIDSPCDCLLARSHVSSGEYRDQGTALFSLVPEGAALWVSATVPMRDVHRLQVNDVAIVRIAGTTIVVRGKVTQIGANIGPFEVAPVQSGMPVVPAATVTIQPDSRIPLEYIGRPASVDFRL